MAAPSLRRRVAVLELFRSRLSVVRVTPQFVLASVSEGGALVPDFPSYKTNSPDRSVGNIDVPAKVPVNRSLELKETPATRRKLINTFHIH
jgi:hypothetical protein